LPPNSRPRLQVADATHAWISLWCGEMGWIGFDPTNDILVENDHIVLAVGRHFSDVSRSTTSSWDRANKSSTWPSTSSWWNEASRGPEGGRIYLALTT
jgi:transglutaminase-like putative cysteine protease